MNNRRTAQVTDAWTSDAPGGSRRVWLWLNEPTARWWSIHATIHDTFGLSWMSVKEMESREWALAAVHASGRAENDDVWESCEHWAPKPVDKAERNIRTAFEIARAAEWSSTYATRFRPVEN